MPLLDRCNVIRASRLKRTMAAAAAAMMSITTVACTDAIHGVALPKRPAVKALPTEGEMSKAVGNTLSSYGFVPFVGGPEIMPDGYRVDIEVSLAVTAATRLEAASRVAEVMLAKAR